MKEQGKERKQMRIYSPTKGKGHEKKQTSISPEASTSGVFTLPIEVGIEGVKAEFVAVLPQKPCVPLEFQTPVDILPAITPEDKVKVAKHLIDEYRRDEIADAERILSKSLSEKFTGTSVPSIKKWVQREREIRKGKVVPGGSAERGRPRKVSDNALAGIEERILAGGVDVNGAMMDSMLCNARAETYAARGQGGSTEAIKTTTTRKYKALLELSMKSTKRVQWNTENRIVALGSLRNFLSFAAGAKALYDGAHPEWGVTAKMAADNPVSGHFYMNFDKTGYQLWGSNAPTDEIWFKHIDDWRRDHVEAGASSKGKSNCLTQSVKLGATCTGDGNWAQGVWEMGLSKHECPDDDGHEGSRIWMGEIEGLKCDTHRDVNDLVYFFDKNEKGYGLRLHELHLQHFETIIYRQRMRYCPTMGIPFTGEPGEDVDFRARAVVSTDGEQDGIVAEENRGEEPGYDEKSEKLKVEIIISCRSHRNKLLSSR